MNPVETLSREALRALQEKRFLDQIHYMFAHSRFYQRKFKAAGIEEGDIRGLDDLSKLPFTTKEELRQDQAEHPPFGSNLSVAQDDVVWCPTTSGTSGVPLLLPRSQQDIDTWIDLAVRMHQANGVTRSDIYQCIMAYQWIFTGMVLQRSIEKVGATAINAGMGNTERQIWCMTQLKPTVVFATPSYFNHLANRLIEENKIDQVRMRIAVSGGEIGANIGSWKEKMRATFPTLKAVLDVGGVTDVGTPIWSECEQQNGAHIWEDSVFVELLDRESGRAVPEGEPGEVVFTDLVSKTAPLLRYKVRDVAIMDTAPCACGRTLARFPRGIIGRVDDMITVRSMNVFPSTIEAVVKSLPELNGEYQIVVDRPHDLDVMTIRVEHTNSGATPAEIAQTLNKKLHLALGADVNIEVLELNTLPRFIYKASRVVDRRKNQTLEAMAELAARQRNM